MRKFRPISNNEVGPIMFLLLLSIGCKRTATEALYRQVNLADSGIEFVNELDYLEDFNIYTYRNFYNGGGIAVGDVNADGLLDIYFTGNMRRNHLYINHGNLQFEEVSLVAGCGGTQAWSTGVSMADVNGDGLLDIYVCNSGDIEGDRKQNELFINQGIVDGVPKFEDQAELYGLDDKGYGTHAAFFDYDRDGDLDFYLLNNSYRSIFDFNLRKNQRIIRDTLGGDKLLRNDGGTTFTDVSVEAGIYGSEIGFGLGVTVGDVNRDGWLDLFISNDFFERDYLYINQGNGTFKEDIENRIKSLSVASMGADMADLTNDGFPEIFVTEMLPNSEQRFKTKMTFESWDRYQYNLENGYYHQFTRNVLQLNNRDNTFSEIGRLAGVEATDWSWGALIADYDNDGLKDLFVSNGLYKDIIDQDYINFVSNEEIVKQMVSSEGVNYRKLIDTIPSTPIANCLFRQTAPLSFENVAKKWGLDQPSFSNGSVYADLDNDGDLEILVNNVNQPAQLFENRSRQQFTERHFLEIDLRSHQPNVYAIGAKVMAHAGDQLFYIENVPTRGFQSSVPHRLHLGLGATKLIDTLVVEWPNGEETFQTGVAVDQIIEIHQKDSVPTYPPISSTGDAKNAPIFSRTRIQENGPHRHRENRFVDFDRDRLLYHMMSTYGPKLAIGDMDQDGLDDVFVCGAAGQSSTLLHQYSPGLFQPVLTEFFLRDAQSEDVDAVFFDADDDGDQDLYVARGGNEFLVDKSFLIDQLYLNDGTGHFSRSPQFLPTFQGQSTGCVEVSDYDKDGDLDLFVGVRLVPGYYGLSANGYLLNNDGDGKFSNVIASVAPQLEGIGMITDAVWIDYDLDQDDDLVVVGEWMPVTLLENQGGKFGINRRAMPDNPIRGWWNCIEKADLDGDGYEDLVVANHGLNSRFKASRDQPISIHVNDFDENGTPDPIISQYTDGTSYPMALRHDLVMQLPSLKKKYPSYSLYAEQQIDHLFSADKLRKSVHKEVDQLKSVILWNNADGKFSLQDLPIEAQFSPIYAIAVDDFDDDGHQDILTGGNLFGVKPEVGRYDASFGLLMRGQPNRTFQTIPAQYSNFRESGEVRDFLKVKVGDSTLLLVANNNDLMNVYRY